MYLKNWTIENLQNEYLQVTNRLDLINHVSINDVRYQSALKHEMLRRVTDKERMTMQLRQMRVIKLGGDDEKER